MAVAVRFRVATEDDFEQIFRLGYETFVEEIPQHPAHDSRRHVDRFHEENTYLVADTGAAIVGMIALRGRRPFSLDDKLGGVDRFLPPDRCVCELRLLAVRREHRRGFVFRGLVEMAVKAGVEAGHDLAIISGTLRQSKLYRHLGFVPFGPLVGTAAAPFQPMYLTLERFEAGSRAFAPARRRLVSFLPGPVDVSPAVRRAFEQPPTSHRHHAFRAMLERVRRRLSDLTAAPAVEVLLGSGTLANDVVAAQLSLLPGPGLVLSNGEFGDRLIDHARRLRLAFETLAAPWGSPIRSNALATALRRAQARWLWAVVSETSTGMLNDLEMFKTMAAAHGAVLAVDCVSALGAVPLDLSGVTFASGASGKAIAALPGLALVFHPGTASPAPDRLPRYLDLGYYRATAGVPFTHSSNLVAALDAALERFDDGRPFEAIRAAARRLRHGLATMGFDLVTAEAEAMPAVVSIALPSNVSGPIVGARLERQGLLVACGSEYLVRKNWIQIALMGHDVTAHVDRLLTALEPIARDLDRAQTA